MNYQSFPVPDREWERQGKKRGTKVVSSWRGPPLRPVDLPTGPRLAWGSRTGASSSAKGVYMGRPGLPRATYATAEENPSLGPPSGLGKRVPKKAAPDWKQDMYSHLASAPVSFVLEGVVGFNVTTAAEIRELRDQLHQGETIYKAEHGELEHNLAKAEDLLHHFDDDLVKEELQAQARQEQLDAKRNQLKALRELVDQNTRELAAARKQAMRDKLRRTAQERAAAAGAGS